MSQSGSTGLAALRASFFAALPRYEDRGALGRGGMGQVFRAFDRELNGLIAIKVLSRFSPEERDSVLRRFKGEVSLNRRISHPNVCRLYDYGVADDELAGGLPYLTMEVIEGRDLRDLIESDTRPTEYRSLQVLKQLTRAVEAAHAASIVHRDLKPANVMVRASGDISVLDFGLAHDSNRTDPRITRAGAAVGTPQYMSPEQLKGLVVDERSDIYAIGAIAFELLTGRKLFSGRSFLSLARKHLETPVSRETLEEHGVSRELAAVILRCLAKKPEDRFQTAAALANSIEALERLQAPRPLSVSQTPAREARVKTAVHRRSSILPAGKPEPARAETEEVGGARSASSHALRAAVLVVDDDDQVRNVICEWLRRAGFEAVPATSGEDALTLFEERTFDLVLMDVLMPRLDGFDTVRILKSRPERASIPVLFMSGFQEKNRVVFAGQTGAVDFLAKPLNLSVLVGKVIAILGKPAAAGV